MKARTTISIDAEIIRKAQEKGLNVSGLTEQAIRDKLGSIDVEIHESSKCEFCGMEMHKATADDPNNGLNWLWPDERWICPKCLETKKRAVIAGKKY